MDEKKTKKRVTFKLHAPEAREVNLAGDFNNWDTASLPLKRDDKKNDGTWQRAAYLLPGSHEYRFIVDGSWCDDPQCAEKSGNKFGTYNSVIRVSVEDRPPSAKRKAGKKSGA